jgi:hypothetical protein
VSLAATEAAAEADMNAVSDAVIDAARVLVPVARLYLGPAGAIAVPDDGKDPDADRKVLTLALTKVVIEAGALPAPGAAYAPHGTAFTIDKQTKMGNALDLGFVLGAMRGLAAWAAAGPMPAAAAPAAAEAAAEDEVAARATSGGGGGASAGARAAPVSTRELHRSARARTYGSSPVARASTARRGGCGCRGGATSTISSSRSSLSPSVYSKSAPRAAKPSRRPECKDPRPHCDCGMSCGGSGCGCNGRTSCTDCIPRGRPAAEACGCTCGTCTPPPESCDPWTPSCATRNRLRACLKDILCELLLCVEQACKGGKLDRAALRACFGDLFCRLLRCLREAICPPPAPCPPALEPPAPMDCLPCSYAVEDPR